MTMKLSITGTDKTRRTIEGEVLTCCDVCLPLIDPLLLNVLFNPLTWKFIVKSVDNRLHMLLSMRISITHNR